MESVGSAQVSLGTVHASFRCTFAAIVTARALAVRRLLYCLSVAQYYSCLSMLVMLPEKIAKLYNMLQASVDQRAGCCPQPHAKPLCAELPRSLSICNTCYARAAATPNRPTIQAVCCHSPCPCHACRALEAAIWLNVRQCLWSTARTCHSRAPRPEAFSSLCQIDFDLPCPASPRLPNAGRVQPFFMLRCATASTHTHTQVEALGLGIC